MIHELVPQGLLTFIKNQVTRYLSTFASSYDGEHRPTSYPTAIDDMFTPANLVTSRAKSGRHRPVLDLDVPAYLVPSTTPGHSHLYIDVSIEEKHYFKLLDRLAKVGILEEGFAKVSRAKGYSALRLPWVAKEEMVEVDANAGSLPPF